MDKSIIRVENLSKHYGNLVAVSNVSFDVKQGEVFGLLGPNGAGKTTALEMIETLIPKTSGTIHVGGFDIDKQPNEIKKIIGVQLQSAGFAPTLRLKELLYLFSALYNVKVDAHEVLDKVDMREKIHAKFAHLSGGQKQRFSIAVTLINKPSIIFLDEPTTGLDPAARRNLWDLISAINQDGTTVVLTTHYMEEAEALCHRVGFIDRGHIIKIDAPQNFIDHLLASGYQPQREKTANTVGLEDVFLDLTGRAWRE